MQNLSQESGAGPNSGQGVPDKIEVIAWPQFMALPYYKRMYPIWHANMLANHRIIEPLWGQRAKSVSLLKARKHKGPAIVCGSGVSLEWFLPSATQWEGALFCSPTNALAPCYYGREPDYIVVLDMSRQMGERIKWDRWKRAELVTHVQASPYLHRIWKRQMWLYRRRIPGHEFFELHLPMMFPGIDVGFKFRVNSATTTAVIASYLGYAPVFLVGVDLGWSDPKVRRSAWYNVRDGKGSVIRSGEGLEETGYKHPIVEDELGIRCYQHEAVFKWETLEAYVENQFDWISCSYGRLVELPYMPIDDVIEAKGIVPGTYQERRNETLERIEAWMIAEDKRQKAHIAKLERGTDE